MRAAVIRGPRDVSIEKLPPPVAGAGEVVIALEGCGVCGSDVPVWEGRPWFEYPFPPGAPGHEGWGRIQAVGDDVENLAIGDRVAAVSYRADAELDVAAADAVVRLPAALDGLPFPGEALGCAMNVFERSGISAEQTVAVVGVGFLGALLIQLAANAGARVVALSRRESALDAARMMGADAVVSLRDRDRVVDEVRRWAGAAMCDRVIEATGTQGPLDIAGELATTRGRVVIAGYHQDGLRTVNMQVWNWKGLDVINAHERDRSVYVSGMVAAAAAVSEGRLDPTPLYTHTFPLDKLRGAFAAAEARPEGFMKALVQP
jgi:NADPH:quinone reductase